MVRADNRSELRPFGVFNEPGPAMTTDVIDGPRRAIGAADDQDALAADLSGAEVARLRNLALPDDIQSGGVVELFEPSLEHPVVGVVGAVGSLRREIDAVF